MTGVNAPESRRGQVKCEIERELGKPVSAWVREREKYGRLLGSALMPDGEDMAEAIVRAGYAVNYDGGKRLGWCRMEGEALGELIR